MGLLLLELLLSFVVSVFEELVLLFEDFDVSLQVKLHIPDHVAFAIQLVSKFNFRIVIFLNIVFELIFYFINPVFITFN